jgi:hypothetical protein
MGMSAISGLPYKRTFTSAKCFFLVLLSLVSLLEFEFSNLGAICISGANSMLDVAHNWGTEAAERLRPFPCDGLIHQPHDTLFRGLTIKAPATTIFLWLCQMRIAPYSYDWIDNGGKQSPRELVPGLDQLEIGQDMMTIFRLVSFARNRQITLRTRNDLRAAKVFGDIVLSYCIVELAPGSCRLLVKLVVKYQPTIRGRLMNAFLPWGDLIMMRRQLLNLKQLAE